MNRDQVLEWLQSMAHPAKAASPQPVRQAEVVVAKKSEEVTLDSQKMQTPAASKQPLSKPVPSKPLTPASQVSTRVATRQLQPYRTYTVRKGDTLWSVAKRVNVDVEKPKYLNGLKGTTLAPGKVLRIPH